MFFWGTDYLFNSDLENEFFAIIDDINELGDEKFELRLDAIGSKWVDDNLRENINPFELNAQITPYIFATIISKEEAHRLNHITNSWSRKWVRLKLTNKVNDRPVEQFIDNAGNPEITTRYIESLSVPNFYESDLQPLNTFFNWDHFKTSSKNQIHQLLNHISRKFENPHLNIYNVGQGNLSAICDKDDIPLIYFDMGGGFAWNRHTYTNPIELFWNKADTIIISHFDMDHLETARRAMYNDWSDFNGKTWIVPKQVLSPSYMKLLSKISVTGNLMVWPDRVKSIVTPSLSLVRCFGPDKNNSGLALIVNSFDRVVMHPADASYFYIDYKNPIQGLVATHHGANFILNNNPIPLTKNGCVVYSYGLNNSYSHPKDLAIQAHEMSQWGHIQINRKDTTIDGHISFGKAIQSKSHCGNSNCIICSLNYF